MFKKNSLEHGKEVSITRVEDKTIFHPGITETWRFSAVQVLICGFLGMGNYAKNIPYSISENSSKYEEEFA